MSETLKVLHVSTGDSGGGAARAAHRIHRAQVKAGLDSRMLVMHRGTDDDCVTQATQRPLIPRLSQLLSRRWHNHIRRGWSTDNPVLHTFGQNSAGLVDELNDSDADILNLHWISDMLSVADIGRLRKPVVWTLHDMWALCGGEHYAPDGDDARFRQGYRADNRPLEEAGPDLNRRTWEAKRRAWAQLPFTIVSPSQWLAECARKSVLFSRSQVNVIPNPLDTKRAWRPIKRDAARTVLDLPLDKKLILFGADGGTSDPRKGADLLRAAVLRVTAQLPEEVELLIYGQSRGKKDDIWPCPVQWLGVVRDDRVLAQSYSAADVMLMTSRQDNLPNTALEAQACGTPLAAFHVGGLSDIVAHCETGWLAKPFDTKNLAEGILWILTERKRQEALSAAARKNGVEKYSEPVVAKAYGELYEQVLNGNSKVI